MKLTNDNAQPVGFVFSKGSKMIRGVKGSKIISKTFKFDGDKIKNKLHI